MCMHALTAKTHPHTHVVRALSSFTASMMAAL